MSSHQSSLKSNNLEDACIFEESQIDYNAREVVEQQCGEVSKLENLVEIRSEKQESVKSENTSQKNSEKVTLSRQSEKKLTSKKLSTSKSSSSLMKLPKNPEPRKPEHKKLLKNHSSQKITEFVSNSAFLEKKLVEFLKIIKEFKIIRVLQVFRVRFLFLL